MFDPSDKTTPGRYGPSQTALLLLDFHAFFVRSLGTPNARKALGTASQLRNWAKSQNIKIIHCLIDTHAPPYETCKDTARFVNHLQALNANGAEEPSELTDGMEDDEVTFLRVPGYVSALRSIGLEKFLREHGIKSLILTGLSTSGCVMRTALAATDAEFVVTVISDGCADREEEVHEFVLGKMVNNRGYVTTATELKEGFSKVIARR
ncbi:Isochorismatase hydrolase [Penicillium argentinense]|uniref:Isochorismatase hydrolase n=1 Tax=Penicillium argentinense TaxID=1131581 RepID=A0A9W9G0B1_9EURO|nr:Isochorismatase hydrolase [Penicillium argentinense]KAJ5109718.1 Isochorismatase hydrolase [Penicillium argentinense]